MTDTLVTSAPSVIVTALRRITRFHGNPLQDSIWGRSARFSPNGETANAHDYCEVYDVIAGEVGLWDRKELGLKEETYLLQVTATGTFEEVRTAIRAANPTFNVTTY